MIMTYETATDAMFGLFKSTWDAGAAAIVGYVPQVYYQGVEQGEIPDPSKYFVVVDRNTVQTQQAGLNNAVARRYETTGVLTIDIFAPRSADQPRSDGMDLADMVRRAIEGSRALGVWFTNVTASEAGQTDSFAMYRVTADFEYTEQGR